MSSPFVSNSSAVQPHDLKKGTLAGTKGNGSLQTTPKRTMSPLKRFNKVAPSPAKLITSATPSAVPTQLMKATAAGQPSSTLQSTSASFLDKKSSQTETEKSERPGSAPLNKVGLEDRKVKQQNVPKPITLEPVIVVRSKNGDLIAQEVEDQSTEGNLEN